MLYGIMLNILKARLRRSSVIRFEELQMRMMDAAKNYLEVYEMSTLIEQYTLNKESRLSMTLSELKPPYPITATVSFSYDAQQTSYSLFSEFDEEEELFEDAIEVDVTISLPFLEGYNNVNDLFDEIANQYTELDPVLVKKEFIRKDLLNGEEYEIVYSYIVGNDELKEADFYEEFFFDLSNILKTIYNKSKFFIETTWYREQEDDSF